MSELEQQQSQLAVHERGKYTMSKTKAMVIPADLTQRGANTMSKTEAIAVLATSSRDGKTHYEQKQSNGHPSKPRVKGRTP